MGDRAPDFGGMGERAIPDVNKMAGPLVGEILDRSERWSVGQKIAGAAISLAAAGVVLGLGSARVVIAGVFALLGISLLTVRRRTLEAENLVLKDSRGRPRFVASAAEDGPVVVLFDENATMRASVFCKQGGPMLTLFDPSGRNRVALASADAAGVSTLMLSGAGDKLGVQLHVSPDGTGGLLLQSATAECKVVADGLQLASARGETDVTLTVGKAASVLCRAGETTAGVSAAGGEGPFFMLSKDGTSSNVTIADDATAMVMSRQSQTIGVWRIPGQDER